MKKANETKKVSKARRAFTIILLVLFWPIILIVAMFYYAYKFDKRKKFETSENKGKFLLLETDISKMDIMEGYEFEELLKSIYFYLGYKTEVTKKSRDYGADLLLTDDQNHTIVVQAKRYNKTVGAKSVQEIAAARDHYNASEAWVVTNSTFSEPAELLARETDVRLIDREELIEHFAKAKTLVSTRDEEKIVENIDLTSFDGFGDGQFKI